MPSHATSPLESFLSVRRQSLATAMVAMVTAAVMSLVPATSSFADDDPERRWAHIVEATGFVENVSGCTWRVCGDPDSFFRQDHNARGIILLDLDQMNLDQQPGPGWWYVDGQFIRDSFEKNATARAGIHRVDLSWSIGGLGSSFDDVTFTVSVSPTGQVIETSQSSLEITSLTPEVEHTFTITATLADGSTKTAPVVSATPLVDPNPDCLPSRQATECLSATNWAHVRISDGLIVNVAVCTKAVCGDEKSDYSRIYRERGIKMVELVNTPAWMGWTYRDGIFFPPVSSKNGEETSPPSGNGSGISVGDEPSGVLTGERSDSSPTGDTNVNDQPRDSGGSSSESLSSGSNSDEASLRPALFDQLVIPQVVERTTPLVEAESPHSKTDQKRFLTRLIGFFVSLFIR